MSGIGAMYRLPSGKWRVERDFDSKQAALSAFDRVTDVTEAAFQPHKTIIASVPRVDHAVAHAAIRDGVLKDDDTLQPYAIPGCATGSCGVDD